MPIYSPRYMSDLTVPLFTWSTKPAASDYTGRYIKVTDVGVSGSLWYSDGTNWLTGSSDQICFATITLPMVVASSATIGADGALSGHTALPMTFSNGLYMYFPANAINSGSAAGWYWTVMSSTTAGTVYDNTYTSPGVPTKPSSPTPFSGTSGAAFTGVTAGVTATLLTLPGGLLGNSSAIEYYAHFITNSTSGSKTLDSRIGSGAYITSLAASTSSTFPVLKRAFVVDSTLSYHHITNSLGATSGTNVSSYSVNYAADTDLRIVLTHGTATDFAGFVGLTYTLIPNIRG